MTVLTFFFAFLCYIFIQWPVTTLANKITNRYLGWPELAADYAGMPKKL